MFYIYDISFFTRSAQAHLRHHQPFENKITIFNQLETSTKFICFFSNRLREQFFQSFSSTFFLFSFFIFVCMIFKGAGPFHTDLVSDINFLSQPNRSVFVCGFFLIEQSNNSISRSRLSIVKSKKKSLLPRRTMVAWLAAIDNIKFAFSDFAQK